MKKRFLTTLVNGMLNINAFSVSSYFLKNSLTVLNYHRIDVPHQSGFDTLKINVSATPAEFERQMRYLKENFNVISCNQLADYIRNDIALPPHSAMVTFDDGYYDNLAYAYPILHKLKIPAVIFLATNFIGTNTPFYWDYASYCFYHTKVINAKLPVIGDRSWSNEIERENVLYEWIETIKKIPEIDKKNAVEKISITLGVSVPEDAFDGLHLTWQQVRELSQNGIEFGGHTMSHPILTRISLEEAKDEIVNSKNKIEQEIGVPVISFAYPNGGETDFSQDVMRIVSEAGIPIAFSLLSGPTSYKTVMQQPLSIRRIFLIHTDSFERFVLKVNGGARVAEFFGR